MRKNNTFNNNTLDSHANIATNHSKDKNSRYMKISVYGKILNVNIVNCNTKWKIWMSTWLSVAVGQKNVKFVARTRCCWSTRDMLRDVKKNYGMPRHQSKTSIELRGSMGRRSKRNLRKWAETLMKMTWILSNTVFLLKKSKLREYYMNRSEEPKRCTDNCLWNSCCHANTDIYLTIIIEIFWNILL